MPLAATEQAIVYQNITVTSVADLVNKIRLALTFAGWTVTAVTDGWKAICISPQGLQIVLYIRELGHRISFVFPYTATLTFETIDGTITGMDHELSGGSGSNYTIVAGICYLNIFQPGINQLVEGSSFFGGIPFVPDAAECGHEVPAFSTNQCWWAMSDAGGNTVTPRRKLITGGTLQNGAEALWNTSYCGPGNSVGSLRIAALTPSSDITNGFNFPSPILWATGDYLIYEPLLCWGETNDVIPMYRGQPYDAMVFSKDDSEMDDVIERDGYQWLCATDHWLYGTYAMIFGLGAADNSATNKYSFTAD